MWATVAVLLTVAVVGPMLAMAADEDPLQDVCVADTTSGVTINGVPCKPVAEVTYKDFVFDGFKHAGKTDNPNKSNVTTASVMQFPGLNTLGISAVRIDFAKGGINPPHIHPRATELLILLKGELYVGFVSSSMGGTVNTLFATTISEGEAFVFPKGLIHFQLNVGKGAAVAFAGLSSQNPGVQQVAPALFMPDIKDEVLEKAFRIDGDTVDAIQKKFRST